jgi:hypothetical protein
MDTIKETQPKKQIDVEYVVYNPQPVYNRQPLHKPQYLHNFGEDIIMINRVNLKRGTYVKEIITKNKK